MILAVNWVICPYSYFLLISQISNGISQSILIKNLNKVFHLIHLYRVDSSTSYLRTGPFQVEGISSYFLSIACFIEMQLLNAKCKP